MGVCLQVRVGKVRVAQAVAEGERHRHARGLVVAVAHVQPLTVLHGAALARKVVLGGGVLIGVGPGFRQLAAGVDLAGQHIDHSACTGLTAQCAVNQRLAVGQPRRFQRCTRAEHDHGVGVCLLYSLQKLNLVVRQLHIGAVQTLALLDFIKAQAEQNHVRLGSQRGGLSLLSGIGLALPVKAGGKANAVQAAFLETFEEGVHLDGVDRTGACALIAGCLGKVTDNGHAGTGGQRQQAFLVLEQDGALCGSAAGQRMVGVGVKLTAVIFHSGVGVKNQRQQLIQTGVNVRLGDFAGLHGLQQLADGIPAGGGHFQRRAVLYAQRMVIAAAPVGDNRAVKAPVLAQDVLQKVGVLVGVGAVDEVVAGHDGLGVRLFDDDFKAGQVEFPQGSLVDDGVRRHAAQLLAVDGEVLGAGGDAVGLDAAHVGRGQLAGKVRVLREILEVAPAQRAALGVEARPQQDGYLLRGGLLPHGLTDLLAEGRVPAAGHGGRSGETGCGYAGVQPQMVRSPGLLAHTVGAVGQGDGRNTRLFIPPGGKDCLAGEQCAFLFKVQLLDDFCVFQG